MKMTKIGDLFRKKKEKLVDLEAIQTVVPESPGLIRELVGIYLDEVPQRMALLAEAVTEKENDNILHLAHLLKGMSGNLSISPLQERFLQLEMMARKKELAGTDALYKELAALFEGVKAELEALLASDKI